MVSKSSLSPVASSYMVSVAAVHNPMGQTLAPSLLRQETETWRVKWLWKLFDLESRPWWSILEAQERACKSHGDLNGGEEVGAGEYLLPGPQFPLLTKTAVRTTACFLPVQTQQGREGVSVVLGLGLEQKVPPPLHPATTCSLAWFDSWSLF